MTNRIFCDFDGTIATTDVTDMLLEAFADPCWREIEALWQSGAISSATCMARQVALLRCSRDELDALLDDVAIDPAFPHFVAYCRENDLALTIVSDGLNYAIERILARAQVTGLSVIANRLMFLSQGRYMLLSPYASAGCLVGAGTCKCAASRPEHAMGQSILIGDGHSDFCTAGAVDWVFAKDALLTYCRQHRIRHCAFDSFADLPSLVSELLAEPTPRRFSSWAAA